MSPQLSIILNTARSGLSMPGFPTLHHFKFTIEALARQSCKDFELIISDYIHDKRQFDWNCFNRDLGFPVYHVPITHSIFKDMGYCAICATKNNGLMYSSGQYIISLDDCCTFESSFVQKVYEAWIQHGYFVNALHIKEFGSTNYRDSSGNLIRDCRYQILEAHKVNVLVDAFHSYGYSTFSMQAALKLNGFNELLDGSRQLEDIEFGERLKLAGYHTALDKNIFVCEQEHTKISPDPGNYHGQYPEWMKEDDVKFGPNLFCNGATFYAIRERKPQDWMVANRHGLYDHEKRNIDPCFMLEGRLCRSSGVECNWLNSDGTSRHMKHPDSRLLFDNPSNFDLGQSRSDRLAIKEKYRVR